MNEKEHSAEFLMIKLLHVYAAKTFHQLSHVNLHPGQIRIARNEIYARHGRIFKSDDLADYFASKSWYTPSVSADQFDNSYLNSIEIENLKLITAYEKAHNLNQ